MNKPSPLQEALAAARKAHPELTIRSTIAQVGDRYTIAVSVVYILEGAEDEQNLQITTESTSLLYNHPLDGHVENVCLQRALAMAGFGSLDDQATMREKLVDPVIPKTEKPGPTPAPDAPVEQLPRPKPIERSMDTVARNPPTNAQPRQGQRPEPEWDHEFERPDGITFIGPAYPQPGQKLASEKQINWIGSMVAEAGWSLVEEFHKFIVATTEFEGGYDPHDMTGAEAQWFISLLTKSKFLHKDLT